jgi:F1F0 ATPase subunit 2
MVANNEIFPAFALLWGLLLGISYFGGLWLTVCFLTKMSRPAMWLYFSFLLRLVLALWGMWIIVRESPEAFFVALIAFFSARFVLMRKIARA